MDSKQAPPPAYTDVSYAAQPNAGYVPPSGDQAVVPSAPGYGNYPGNYSAPPPAVGYGGQAPGYYPPQQPGGYPPTQGGGYAYSQAVVVNQPVRQGAVITTVPDHMGLAIFVTICCCWPLGLVAIMRAQESRRAVERGDYPAANTYSQEARRYSMWAIAGGCVSIVVAIIIIVVYVTTFTASTTTYYG